MGKDEEGSIGEACGTIRGCSSGIFNSDTITVNRIILASDGDFNVGMTDEATLKKFIESKRETGIFLSVLGFGMGNYKDSIMQTLANHGNGVASYIDTINEAHKVLVEEATSTLFPIAKDVKVQVEFNPATVAEYRLVGYEKRLLNEEDFNNDEVDAAEIGSGHTVTAIYEITPASVARKRRPKVDERRYGIKERKDEEEEGDSLDQSHNDELGYIKIRYKLPGEDASKLISLPIMNDETKATSTTTPTITDPQIAREFQFATAVAGFAQILKGRTHINKSFDMGKVLELAQDAKGPDEYGYRSEFIGLVRKASVLLEKPTLLEQVDW